MNTYHRVGCVLVLAYSLFQSSVALSATLPTSPGDAQPTASPQVANPADLHYYETVPGKVMGIWPDSYSVEWLATLRVRYGFSYVVVVPDAQVYNNALQAGYTWPYMMIDMWDLYRTVDNFRAGFYYKDEASEHDCYGHSKDHLFTPGELATYRDYVHQKWPGSFFVISGYKRCSHNKIAATYADAMMYSSYKNWDAIFFQCHVNIGWGDDWEDAWLAGNDDQRDSWTQARITYTGKNFMNWINGTTDDFNSLFAHANYLNLIGLWQWNPGPIDSIRLESYCYAAWQNGWMNRVSYTPLPIQLASLSARFTPQKNVLVEWVTLSETANLGFEVQRKSAGVDTFSTLKDGFVPGHGTTLATHRYSFLDSAAPPGTWYYRLKQIDLDGAIHFSQEVSVSVLTEVREDRVPTEFVLHQNYPNPFNPATTISYSIPAAHYVRVEIYDQLGREVARLVDKVMPPGLHKAMWDAREYPSGLYLCKLIAGSSVQTKKLLLIR